MKYYNTRRRGKIRWLPLLLLCLLATLALGCGKKAPAAQGSPAASEAGYTEQDAAYAVTEEAVTGDSLYGIDGESGGREVNADEPAPDVPDPGGADPGGNLPEEEGNPETLIEEDGVYTSAEDVALYLHTYGKLPRNYISKSKARKLGWNGGSLEDYAPGMCIGGGPFGNNEGILPEGNYRECDIDTLGRSRRGAKRLVYDDRGNIYYTEDHYETFIQLYEGN